MQERFLGYAHGWAAFQFKGLKIQGRFLVCESACLWWVIKPELTILSWSSEWN